MCLPFICHAQPYVCVHVRVCACAYACVCVSRRLPDDARRIENQKEFWLKTGLILVALAWFWSIVRVLWSLDLNLRQQIFGWFHTSTCPIQTGGILHVSL
jgi:hypothetical protein